MLNINDKYCYENAFLYVNKAHLEFLDKYKCAGTIRIISHLISNNKVMEGRVTTKKLKTQILNILEHMDYESVDMYAQPYI